MGQSCSLAPRSDEKSVGNRLAKLRLNPMHATTETQRTRSFLAFLCALSVSVVIKLDPFVRHWPPQGIYVLIDFAFHLMV